MRQIFGINVELDITKKCTSYITMQINLTKSGQDFCAGWRIIMLRRRYLMPS
uniref:Uncharacterized protein n=1 Tax=Megaselia scalaris TaxID=36166 RepID=T1H2V0_MEGSC